MQPAGYGYLDGCNGRRAAKGEEEMCLRIKTGRYGALHSSIYRRGRKYQYLLVVGERRFGYQVIAITMKTVGAEVRYVAIRTTPHRVFVVRQPVVQYLLGRNAERKNDQQ